jgi:hypothetical protein
MRQMNQILTKNHYPLHQTLTRIWTINRQRQMDLDAQARTATTLRKGDRNERDAWRSGAAAVRMDRGKGDSPHLP